MRAGAIALLLVAGVTSACGGSVVTEKLERTAEIQFRTIDGATAQGTTPVEAMVVDRGVAVDEALLADIAERAVLRTWPEDLLVGFTVEHELTSSMGLHVVRIVPAAGLEDRWYLATFDTLPTHVYVAPPGGEGGVRVRPGSHPRMASVQFCVIDDPAAAQKVVVGFSEPVAVPPADAISFEINGQPAACDRYSATEGELLFTCPALTPTASVTVAVGSGITARSGVGLPSTRFTVDLPHLPPGVCRPFAPPL